MNISRKLHEALACQDMGVRRAFQGLTDDERRAVEEAYFRHRVACERTGLPVDPGFLREVVHDVRFGMYEAEEPLAPAAGV
jgi:hypothetical protein